jgi:AcrR family transcriptional regulator
MVQKERKQLARDDWLKAALSQCTAGIDTVKVAPLAEQLGVTTGSFYWHFKNRRELLEAMLEYWEHEMTDVALDAAKRHPGPPAMRILDLMNSVMSRDLAHYDLPIWQWAQTDANASLRQTFVEWAAETINKSFWAGAYYRQQRDKGCTYQAAVRALAFKWIRILYRCW